MQQLLFPILLATVCIVTIGRIVKAEDYSQGPIEYETSNGDLPPITTDPGIPDKIKAGSYGNPLVYGPEPIIPYPYAQQPQLIQPGLGFSNPGWGWNPNPGWGGFPIQQFPQIPQFPNLGFNLPIAPGWGWPGQFI